MPHPPLLWGILLTLLALVTLVLLSPVRVEGRLSWSPGELHWRVRVRLLLVHVALSSRKPGSRERKMRTPRRAAQARRFTPADAAAALPIVRALMRRTTLREARLTASFGLPDAAATGVVTGAAWSVAGVLPAALAHFLSPRSQRLRVEVRPDFFRTGMRLETRGIIRVRTVHIMIAALRLMALRRRLRRRREGD